MFEHVSRPEYAYGMAAFWLLHSLAAPLTDNYISELLNNGDVSEIEDFDIDEDDFDLEPNILFALAAEEDCSSEEQDDKQDVIEDESSSIPESVVEPPEAPIIPPSIPSGQTTRTSRQGRSVSVSSSTQRSRVICGRSSRGGAVSTLSTTRRRVWKQVPFEDGPHNYMPIPTKPVRRPVDYFRDYFDDDFIEKISHCTNLYYLRSTGRELKCTSTEITKLLAIHIIMGCVPYPRLPMYWRAGTKLGLICNIMSRDRYLTLRNALHVVEGDSAPDSEKGNVLWKVQPMIDKVKDTCNKLERVGFYSIDEQMIPFTGRCKLRQVVKNKPRPVGLKNFVMTTSEGLMLDFAIYEGAKTMFGESNLGLGPSVILSLAKSIPPGSCVYHDRYFTTVPLIEEMEKLNLHSTGTIMQNRIPDRATIKFKKDSAMRRGECQQFVCEPTVLVKWKDNKSVLLASNCTGASHTTSVKRWDKTSNSEEIRRL
ncbi:PiggyBac transposable element-derived protein 3 [Eumeta japonica]|uniref:PiggyBac transposable element-derived protein 3 n=4 Tax=Eumeta variegata TaxID=151549 RepID=A0A4C1SQQ3_EUMVA|nr:PiggyBac transposable element-derived protein 3 [Eumeta japonica]